MLFTVIIGLLFVAVVFFHYLQGLFSATLSAIFAVIAAALAFSWHETIVEKVVQGKVPNTAHAIVLVALFAVIYLILRIIFDKLVPTGVTLPQIIDRVGGAILGAVAATFCLGIFAIAAEELPFGPSVAGYTKYDAGDKSVQVVGISAQNQTGTNFNELHSNDAGRFNEEDRKNLFPLILPGVDEIVVATVAHLSDTGSLQGDQPLTAVHPDFLQEIYAQDIGIQTGAKHVTMNNPNSADKAIRIDGLFTESQVLISDVMQPSVRGGYPGVDTHLKLQTVDDPARKRKLQYGSADLLLVVRMTVNRDAADEDSIFRFSPGSIRLVAKRPGKSGSLEPANYYPIGTLEVTPQGLPVLYADKMDDYLLVQFSANRRSGVDLVFAVDKAGLMNPSNKTKIDDGVFIEVKRLFREDLSGRSLSAFVRPSADVTIGVVHQKTPQDKLGFPSPTTAPAGPTTQPVQAKP